MKLAKEYAELTLQEKQITERKAEINVILLQHMQDNELGTIKAEYGTFSKAQKLVYEFGDIFKEVEKELKDEIKNLKKEEQKKITPTIKEYLIFRSI